MIHTQPFIHSSTTNHSSHSQVKMVKAQGLLLTFLIHCILNGASGLFELKAPESFHTFQLKLTSHNLIDSKRSVTVRRSNLETDILGIYSSSSFRRLKEGLVCERILPFPYFKRLKVKFTGEEGLDYGGLSREFFWLGSFGFLNGIHKETGQPYFEGEDEHKIPNPNIPKKVYVSIGRFMMDMALHHDKGFPGLSPAVVHFIMAKDNPGKRRNRDKIPMDIQDLPDPEDRNRITKDELYEGIIEPRLAQLKSLRRVYRSSPVGSTRWSNQFQHDIFPRSSDLKYKPSEVIARLDVRKSSHYPGLKDDLEAIITEKGQDPDWIRGLLQMWTGSGVLDPKCYLSMSSIMDEDEVIARISTCSRTIDIPLHIQNKADLEILLNGLIGSVDAFNEN